MAGRKGQRSGGHNKKAAEEHERDGTRSCEGDAAVPAGALDFALGNVDTDAKREMQRLYAIYEQAAECWQNDPTDKDARLSATAAFDRFIRIACEIAREKPKEDAPPPKTDGPAISMADLLNSRGGNGASQPAS